MAVTTATLLWGGVILGALGTVAGATTSVVQGAEQAAMAEYNQSLANQQAAIQQQNAERARQQAENEAIAKERDSSRQAELERERMERVKSLNRAREGASGFTMEGTPLLMQIEAAENIEMNHLEMLRKGKDEAAFIRYQGELTAYGHRVGAVNSQARANAYGNMAGNAMTGGFMQAGTTLLSGAGDAFAAYSLFKKK